MSPRKTKRAEVDATQAWCVNASDDLAVRNGCWFDPSVGGYAVWWIERYCRLYEGEWAGEPMRLRGADGEPEWPIPDEFDERLAVERAACFAEQRASGVACDWQYEATMRMFGWLRKSVKWKRNVRRHRYASVWVAKKNKKTPTMSAWALYLECGDGEPGQKVFLLSKDAKQVRDNAARHILEMVDASFELSNECKINRVEMQVTHLPSRSILKPMSSSGAANQKAKEGLNGSAFVDETHVVDRALMKRVDRMGISRSEPMICEFSTAGNDPDSYGKERFDYACQVRDGLVEDDSLMVAVYAAPQDLTDADLAADPVKYGRMANPAWGHTIDEEEYLADYTRSRTSENRMLDFKMYRLNIWQNSAAPWIKASQWQACEEDFSVGDFAGQECYAGLDLSSVSDFTSLCLCFPCGVDTHRLLWWYWVPEEMVMMSADKIPIRQWQASDRCNLMVTPGARVDYGYIRSTVRDLAERVQIKTLAYDKWNAEQTTQEISEGVCDSRGNQIEPATGIRRVVFPQGMAAMSGPTKAFEAAVLSQQVRHNGDPLTAWMFSNATLKRDHNENCKPVKPPLESMRKIDGVVSAIMARAVAVQDSGSASGGGLILL